MKVLLVTDLSEAGLRSVEGLCACGGSGFERVTLLHVIDLDLYTAGGSVPGISEWAHAELDKAADDLSECGFEVETRVETGPALDTIKAVAEEIGADLIVATNLGKGAVVGRLLGSTAERLASATNLPVLLERVGHEGERWCRLGSGSPFERILLGVDLIADLPALVDRVVRMPGARSVRLVHVAVDENARLATQSALENAAAGLDLGVPAETCVEVGDAAEQLIAQAQEADATVIAVASCRHGMVHRAALGSVARSVAINADRAVLLLPPA